MEHPLTKSSEYLLSHSLLEKNISGMGVPGCACTEWHAIFFTGGTGFIGGFLLKEILDTTKAVIYCLTRGSSAKEGKKRLVDSLQEKGIWREEYYPRLKVIPGDLNLPKLGLSGKNLMDLADKIDIIFHLGASIKWISNYTKEARANVLNFIELLKLATARKTIPIHYSSSMSIYASAKKYPLEPIFENELFEEPGSLIGGYCQSKWVCEKIVEQARKRNVPINLYRIGEVNGDSRTGITDTKKFISLFIYFCLMTQMAPESYRLTKFNLLPVDYISKAIVHISKYLNDNGTNYQFNSAQLFTLEEMVNEMNKCGYEVRMVSDDLWEKAMNEKSGLAKKLKTIFKKLNINKETQGVSFFDIGQNVFLRSHDTSNTDQLMTGSNPLFLWWQEGKNR